VRETLNDSSMECGRVQLVESIRGNDVPRAKSQLRSGYIISDTLAQERTLPLCSRKYKCTSRETACSTAEMGGEI